MWPNLIGRDAEIKLFQGILESKVPEFLAIYGRRRVGKTYLIREFFQNQGVYFELIGEKDASLKAQLQNFTHVLSKTFFDQSPPLKPPPSWKEAFILLNEQIQKIPTHKKIILFFDELPWLHTKRSGLIQAIDYNWNSQFSKRKNIIFIACGSSASWILEHLIYSKGGLYNRVTKRLLLKPFLLPTTNYFLKMLGAKYTPEQVIEFYMAMGGIPYYLKQVEKDKSATQNINKLFFTRDGLLFKEFHHLFPSLFGNDEVYEKIIRTIASKRYGISRQDLIKALKISSGGRIKKRLDELESSGFIDIFVPFGNKRKDFYIKLVDEYAYFYLKWIDPIINKKTSLDQENYWHTLSKEKSWEIWAGYSFEMLCLKHISQILTALKIQDLSLEMSSWRHFSKDNTRSGCQIDLVIDRTDNSITLCEIKYSKDIFVIDKSYAKELHHKIDTLKEITKTKKQIFFAFITTYGIKRNMWSEELVHSEVTLKDLFNVRGG